MGFEEWLAIVDYIIFIICFSFGNLGISKNAFFFKIMDS